MKIAVMIFEKQIHKRKKNQEQGEREQGNHSFVRERMRKRVKKLNESARNVREAQSNVGLF